ncbi:hypothetical protein AVEN_110964-1 [Araneus ventricosus]|uniref:Uncharacterized protein n=1 Tax=Araneus ventricosus TaxID=182803 RepID=A0A4Y2LI50_ARAVE|nr:hypothetical protein AVEN_110964-1 [Araneus ventricosus]
MMEKPEVTSTIGQEGVREQSAIQDALVLNNAVFRAPDCPKWREDSGKFCGVPDAVVRAPDYSDGEGDRTTILWVDAVVRRMRWTLSNLTSPGRQV